MYESPDLGVSGGWQVSLREGEYGLAELRAAGAVDEQLSSISVVSQRHLAHSFSAVFRPFCAALSPFFPRCPASWRQDGENGRKMAKNGRNLGEKRARNSGG